MVLVNSTMLPLGTNAPEFELPDVVTGRTVLLENLAIGKRALLVMFLSRHCPYVKHVQSVLAALANEYAGKGVGVVAIASNDAMTYPDDAPASLAAQAKELGFSFPYLFDEFQTTARAYRAACTPDFYVFNMGLQLVYRGQMDDSRPGNGKPVTGKDLRAALDAALAGQPAPADQRPSAGCNIKWKPGQAPDYFAAG
jgi:thiol-disulfide isomerase/thioredoxin